MKALLNRFSSFVFLLLSLFLINTKTSFAADPAAWTGKCVGTGDASDVATIQGFECLFGNILQVIVYFAGLAFLIMFINGGFQYLFSSKDSKKVAAASSTLTMSIIGLAGIIISWFILRFITNFTGINVLNFIIPG